MRPLPKTLLAAALLAASGAAAANSLIDRGYHTCIGDLEADYPRQARMVHARYYYHAVAGEQMSYFVNSSAWQDGDRVSLRTLCTTDRYGHELRVRETLPGRWDRNRSHVTVDEVASR